MHYKYVIKYVVHQHHHPKTITIVAIVFIITRNQFSETDRLDWQRWGRKITSSIIVNIFSSIIVVVFMVVQKLTDLTGKGGDG